MKSLTIVFKNYFSELFLQVLSKYSATTHPMNKTLLHLEMDFQNILAYKRNYLATHPMNQTLLHLVMDIQNILAYKRNYKRIW